MAGRTMTVRLLVVALVIFMLVPPGAAESPESKLPRLEFEAPEGGWAVEPADPDTPAPEARQAGPLPPGLPSLPVLVPDTLRGVMGYRLPLVSRQQVPAQVVSGVLIPAHTTYVILQPGYWELVGLSPAEVEALRAATNADEPAESQPPARGWNPLRLFRRSGAK